MSLFLRFSLNVFSPVVVWARMGHQIAEQKADSSSASRLERTSESQATLDEYALKSAAAAGSSFQTNPSDQHTDSATKRTGRDLFRHIF